MKKVNERTEVVKEEIIEFDDPPEGAISDTYTRRSVDGDLASWIPHDEYGPLQFGTSTASPTSEVEEALEAKYQQEIDQSVIEASREAREKAFAPYSEYKVGAAVLTDKGIFSGANIEVSGRSTSVHAEMLAMFKAVLEGATEFHVMAVSLQDQNENVAPCGLCQHTISQFTEELRILEDGGEGSEHGVFWLSDLINDGYSASTRHFDKIAQS